MTNRLLTFTHPSANGTAGRGADAAVRTSDQAPPDEGAGLTVADVAARLRVSPDKVRKWIERGELVGINTATTLSARPRYVVTREALAEFERKRAAGPRPKPAPRRRRSVEVDFYP